MYWLLAVAALSFLIVVHEGGHYFVARWCGMRIDRFSLGFGPGILKRRAKSGTIFQLAPLPFGGFVEIRGMNIAEDVDPEDQFAYPNRPTWQRFLTIFAGPATNYVSAVVLAFALYFGHGADQAHWYGVDRVLPDSPAQGKLEPGDRILAVDHHEIFVDRDEPGLTERITQAGGKPVTLTIERDGKPADVVIQPKPDKDASGNAVWRIGIGQVPQDIVIDLSLWQSLQGAFTYPVRQSQLIVVGMYEVITGKQKADVGGPKRIFDEFHKAFVAGLVPGLKLLMMLSVYLGLFNLLPVPALDGGRLVFLGYELITRRRANPKIEATVHMGGIMVLGLIMVVVTLHDCHLF